MRILRVAAPAILLATLALSLTACDPGADGSPPATPKPTITTTPTPTPTPEPEAFVPTCENIVTPATIAGFAADGLEITPPAEFAAKLAGEGQGLSAFFDAGGVLCQVGGEFEAFEIYGYAVLSEAQYAPVVSDFLRDGYVETMGDVGIEYRVPDGAEGLPRVCYFRPDAWSVCGDDDRIEEIITTLGLS